MHNETIQHVTNRSVQFSAEVLHLIIHDRAHSTAELSIRHLSVSYDYFNDAQEGVSWLPSSDCNWHLWDQYSLAVVSSGYASSRQGFWDRPPLCGLEYDTAIVSYY